MPSHLVISVTFLQATCHARLGKEAAAANEWPPSPLRLFQAMVAGAAARWASAPVDALKWLESLCATSPPTILAPRATTGQGVPRWVPNNSADLVAAKWSQGAALATFEDRARKVFRPTHMLDGTTVHYLWPLDETHRSDAPWHDIVAAARSIVALGWGIDAAIGDACIIDDDRAGTLPGQRWLPGRVGTAGLRVPVPGTLEALAARHAKFLNRLKDGVFHPVPPLRAFQTVAYHRVSDLPSRPFAAFVLRPLDSDRGYAAFAATEAVCIAAMLRHAACQAARGDLDDRPGAWRTNEWALRFVAGHGPEGSPKRRNKHDTYPRFSYLPLPSIGHRHADGMIRRVIMAEPFGGDGRSARWASLRLAGVTLQSEARGPAARLEPVEPYEKEFTSVFRGYAARSYMDWADRWTSVTPVILPGFDDGKREKAEGLLVHAIRQAGLPVNAVAEFVLRKAPFWAPAQHSSRFQRPNYLTHLPAWHVRLRFREPVSGPISLGAGRHCGLGVLARLGGAR